MFRNKGKAETNRFCHQIPKLSQEKGETDSDFAKRCITEMREFIDSIDKPADDQFLDDNIALTTTQQIQTRDTERQVIIDAIAKECFLMGVNQSICVKLMQKDPATLNKNNRNKTNLSGFLHYSKILDLNFILKKFCESLFSTTTTKVFHKMYLIYLLQTI